jgi:hypothetical protein
MPGCYGTYIAQCIYNYTNLRIRPFEDFKFDEYGSSHHFWDTDDEYSPTTIRFGHIDTDYLQVETDQVLVILPCKDHKLDYYNNIFFKNFKGQVIKYILESVPKKDIVHALESQWGYTGKLDDSVPRWILREWCSFWINDLLENSIVDTEYKKVKALVQITTQHVFENWLETLTQIASLLNLTFTVDETTIKKQHENFLKLQKFHNSQLRCHQYVNDLLVGNDNKMILHSIFDEAYMQHLLRKNNLEIYCNNLNVFPSTVQQLKNLTYETMHHTNT